MNTPKLPKGVTLHRGKLRIAFRPAGFTNQVKRSLGLDPTKANIKVAEMKLNAIRNDIMIGRFDIADHFPNDPLSARTTYTGAQLLDEFVLKTTGEKANSKANMATVDKCLRPIIGKMDLKHADRATMLQIQQQIRAKRSDTRTNELITHLSTAIKKAMVAALLEQNITKLVSPIAIANVDRRIKAYSQADAQLIIDRADTDSEKRMLTFLFYSGIRHGEFAALLREDVDPPFVTIRRNMSRNGTIDLPKTKNGLRTVRLPKRAEIAIKEQLLSHSLESVWLHRSGRPYRDNTIFTRDRWRALTKDLDRLTPYVTRHSFCSWAVQYGENLMKVANHMGHANIEMIIKRYSHFIPEKDDKWTLDDPTQ